MTSWVTIEHVDALPIGGSTLEAIDMHLVERHLKQARGVSVDSALTYLHQRRGVIEHEGVFIPTLGGVLCFGRDPQRWLPHTGIALTRYSGATPNSQQVIDIRDLHGSLFALIDQAEEYLWSQSTHGFRLDAGPRRIPLDQYPRTALRELIVNAVAHRDYRVSGSRVKIELFRNEVEWSSPGGLPPSVTVENILKAQYTRNPVIVSFLFDAGYIEQRGMGLDTVVAVLGQEGLPLPQMEDTGASFLIRISGHGSVDRLHVLGLDPTLMQVYTWLERVADKGARAKELSVYSGIPLRTINRRLQDLVDRKLVRRTGTTSNVRYFLSEPHE